MTYLWPAMLWLLLLAPLLICVYVVVLRRRNRAAIRYSNLALVRQAMGRNSAWRRHVPPALLLVAVSILVLALARPAAVLSSSALRGTVILAMDVSSSMAADDIAPTRLEAAQAAAKEFIANQPADVQVGIVSFAGTAELVQTPTLDREVLLAAIDRFELQIGTAVGSGILAALSAVLPDQNLGLDAWQEMGSPMASSSSTQKQAPGMKEEPAARSQHAPVGPGSKESGVIILLTDGATTAGPDPRQAARIASEHGIRVFTVGFGTEGGDHVNVAGRSIPAAPDFGVLRFVAETTKASFFEAQSREDLSTVYASVSKQLVSERALTDIAFIFAAAGALAALASGGLSLLWFGRIA